MSTASIIERLGGTGAVAEVLGLSPAAVSCWKSRQSIPAEHWTALVALGERSGKRITLEDLAALHARGAREVSE